MEIIIKIPKEFEEEFNRDKFEDSLARVASDIESFGFQLAGRYEQETIKMLREVLKDSVIIPKGHGELKDVNELKKAYDERIAYLYTLNKKDNPSREAKICATNWCVNTIDELPTIIEADSLESEGK